MPVKPTELAFPLRGIDEGWGYGRQPEGTTPDARNVRPFDILKKRLRGGQRPGLTKFLSSAVNGTNFVQEIDQVTLALDPGAVDVDQTIFEEDFTSYGSDDYLRNLNVARWPEAYTDGTNANPIQNTCTASEGNKVTAVDDAISDGDGAGGPVVTITGNLSLTSSFVIETGFTLGTYGGAAWELPRQVGIAVRIDTVNKQCITVNIRTQSATTCDVHLYKQTGSGSWTEIGTYNLFTLPGGHTWENDIELKLSVNGNIFNVYLDGSFVLTATDSNYSSNTKVGIVTGRQSGDEFPNDTDSLVKYFNVYTGSQPQSLRQVKLVVVAGGSVYTGDKNGILLAGSGSSVLSATRWVSHVGILQRSYLSDGFYANYSRVIHSTDQADDWGAAVIAYDGTTTLPRGSTDTTIGCRFGALYRGRIILWGLYEEPHNWFMSKVGEPLDWQYSPATTSAIQAVAGNNSDAGELGDVLICCAPYSDDIMIMGGDHTLWVMRGDPADRGRIDSISYQTGIVGPRAYTWDTQNTFYFLGASQLWRMDAGNTQPESISRNRLDVILGSIDLTTQEVKLTWDRDNQGLHILLVPSSEPSTAPIHIYWDQRTDSFWRDQFPATMGPTTAFSFDADDPDDRAILFGGWDSFIRYVDTSVKNDDGTAINSYIYYAPMNPGQSMRNLKINRITALLDNSSDAATLTAYAEDSVQSAVDSSSIRFAASLTAGRNVFIPRITGNTVIFKLSDATVSKAWAAESLFVNIEMAGRTRKYQL